ncbi:hypothetical protein PG997_011198 [Apiospora hydei]|uniref:Uncharacterized protein n=1 Tax=Apiospora hydei TaxID=1337664 RepID=A0ABR1VIG1_9PEZI
MPCPQLVQQLLYRDYGAASISSSIGEAIRAHARAQELAAELGFDSAPSSPVMSPMTPPLSDSEDEGASSVTSSPPARKRKHVHMGEPEVGSSGPAPKTQPQNHMAHESLTSSFFYYRAAPRLDYSRNKQT